MSSDTKTIPWEKLYPGGPHPQRTGAKLLCDLRHEAVGDYNSGGIGEALDAPEYMAAGACRFQTYQILDEQGARGFPVQVKVVRP